MMISLRLRNKIARAIYYFDSDRIEDAQLLADEAIKRILRSMRRRKRAIGGNT